MKTDLYIQYDQFSGHLFHDVEMMIMAFAQAHSKKINKIFYVHNTSESEKIDSRVWDKVKGSKDKTNFFLKKLFGVNGFTKLKSETDDFEGIYIKRKTTKHGTKKGFRDKGINKAFATEVLKFPYVKWFNRLHSNSTIPDLGKIKILYPHRQTCRHRWLDDQSHNKIMELVEQFGGTTVGDLSDMSIEEQLELYKNHNCLVGPHGNNLTGCAWMQSPSFTIEILPSATYPAKAYDYQCLSWCMGHKYQQIKCDRIGNEFSLQNLDMVGLERQLKLWAGLKYE